MHRRGFVGSVLGVIAYWLGFAPGGSDNTSSLSDVALAVKPAIDTSKFRIMAVLSGAIPVCKTLQNLRICDPDMLVDERRPFFSGKDGIDAEVVLISLTDKQPPVHIGLTYSLQAGTIDELVEDYRTRLTSAVNAWAKTVPEDEMREFQEKLAEDCRSGYGAYQQATLWQAADYRARRQVTT